MSFVGGLMKQVVQAATAAGALEIISRTETADRIINDAANRAEAVAEFFEGIENFLTSKEVKDDISL